MVLLLQAKETKGASSGIRYLPWQPLTVSAPTGVKTIYMEEATSADVSKETNSVQRVDGVLADDLLAEFPSRSPGIRI